MYVYVINHTHFNLVCRDSNCCFSFIISMKMTVFVVVVAAVVVVVAAAVNVSLYIVWYKMSISKHY